MIIMIDYYLYYLKDIDSLLHSVDNRCADVTKTTIRTATGLLGVLVTFASWAFILSIKKNLNILFYNYAGIK